LRQRDDADAHAVAARLAAVPKAFLVDGADAVNALAAEAF
jgi:hypothetical protein